MSSQSVAGAGKAAEGKIDAMMREALLAGLRQAWQLQQIAIKDAQLAQIEIQDFARMVEAGAISPMEAMRQLGGDNPVDWFRHPLRLVTTGQCMAAAREGGLEAIAELGIDVPRFLRQEAA